MRGIIQANSPSAVGNFNVNEFNKLLEEAYAKTARPKSFKTKKSFSPSTVGYAFGTCPRYWYHAFNGATFDEKTDNQGIANMARGSEIHERIQAVLAKTDVLAETEREITFDDPPIRGFADVILNWNGIKVVGEIKSAKEEIFAIRKAENSPSPAHLLQILMYMHVEQAEEGFVLYENKNTQEIWTIPVKMNKRNKEFVEKALDWMRTVYQLSKETEPPERAFTKSTYQCKACPVFDTCWSGEKGTIKLQALELSKI